MGAFNGSGVFLRSFSWQQDATAGLDILADRFDAEDDGFANGLSQCITRDGQGVPTAAITWGNQNLTGVNALGAVTGAFSGQVTVATTLGVTGVATFSLGSVSLTPNAGTTGGVRIAGNATSGNAILQFTDSTLATQWGYILLTSAGVFNFSNDIDMGGHAVKNMFNGSSVQDGAGTARYVGYRNFPFTAASAGRTIALTDVGEVIPATGTINVPTNAAVAFAIGDIVGVYNNSGSAISITASGGVTLRLGGSATTGTRTLAQRGLVSLLKVATDEWVALNGGIS